MYTRILVPLDGSPRAERSVPVAAMLARASHGSVILLQVLSTVGELGPVVPTSYSTTLLEEERHEVNAYLVRIASLPVLSGVPTETEVLNGPPAIAILDALTTYKADVVVITSHGRTGITRWALGSVAEHVIRHATVPIVVLREQGESPAEHIPDHEHLPRVLVPLDGSSLSETVLEPAVDMAKALAAPARGAIHLLLVVSPFEAAEANLEDEAAIGAAKDYLGSVASKVRARHNDIEVTWSVAVNTEAASGVLRSAEDRDEAEGAYPFGYDVIAMATHGRSGLSRWMFGSITERVLRTTRLAMLIVHPGPVEEKQQVREIEVGRERAASDIPAWSGLF